MLPQNIQPHLIIEIKHSRNFIAKKHDQFWIYIKSNDIDELIFNDSPERNHPNSMEQR